MCVCVCACSQHLKATPGQSAAAAAKAAADKAAAKVAADKAAVAKAAAEKAAADRAAAEELRRRATALGLLQVLTPAGIADDATLKKSIAWCDEQGVTSVSDMVEYDDMVEDFVRHLGLKTLPGKKLLSMLQPPTARLAGQLSDRLPPSPESAAQQAPAAARVKRWGDGLEAPAAGSRNFVPQGFEVTLDVPEAIARFGHSASHVTQIMDAGRAKASTSPTPLAPAHAAALYAYTEETPLYGTLNYTCLLYTSPSPRDRTRSRMPSSA